LRKSDSMGAMLEYKLQRDMNGGANRSADDIPSLLVANQSTGGHALTRAQIRPAKTATVRSTERIQAADSWTLLLHHLDHIPPTVTASPIQALAGAFVDAIQQKQSSPIANSAAATNRCKSMMESCGWDWDRNVPTASAEPAQLKAGVLRAAKLALEEFPDQDEEELMLRHSKMGGAGGNVRPHYGAYADAAVVNVQENEMQCEALLHTLIDIQNLIIKLEDEHTTLRGVSREHAEVARRIGQLMDQIDADARAAVEFENLEIKNQARIAKMPFSALHEVASETRTAAYRQYASDAAQEVVQRTHQTLERECDELERLQTRLDALAAARADHVADARFCERQLDICVTILKDCGLQHVRGSTTLDLRGAMQKDAVERNVMQAVDQIVESVSQLQLVNRGFHKGAKFVQRPTIGFGRTTAV